MIDETSTKKGHNYATNFMRADSNELLFGVEGKGQETIAAFAAEMPRHGASPEQITEIIMDMSKAFIAGAKKVFPAARVIFDHFHIMQLAGNALDEVRKDLASAGADLKDSIWAIRGNEWTRTEQQLQARQQFIADYPVLGRALGLRDCLQDMLSMSEEEGLRGWCAWADRSRPFESSPGHSKFTGTVFLPSWKPASQTPPWRPSTGSSRSPSAWPEDSATSTTSASLPTSKQEVFN